MEPLLEQVAAYVQERAIGEPIVDRAQLPGSCPLAVRTEGSLAFFRQTAADLLQEHWRQTQTEIAALPADRLPLRKLYLTLLVIDSDRPHAGWQHIVRDLHVCRKLVVSAARHPVADWIDELPFLPLAEEVVRPRTVITPANALYQAGFRADLANDLLSRGVEQLARQFCTGSAGRGDGEPAPEAMALTARSTYRRLLSMELENFRPFAHPLTLPLDADLTLIYGPNGSGKSSIAQALEWSIIGAVSTLEQPHADVNMGEKIPPYINVTNPDTPAWVRLHLQGEAGGHERALERRVTRDGAESIRWDGKQVTLTAALKRVLDVRAADVPVAPPFSTLKAMARQSHFLSQETIRDFLSTNAQDRYHALANMVGTVDFERASEKLGDVARAVQKQLDQALRTEQELSGRLEAERRSLADVRLQLDRASTHAGRTLDLLGAAGDLARAGADVGLPVRPTVPADTAGLAAFARSLLDGLDAARSVAQERHARLSALSADEQPARQARADAAGLRDRHATSERELAALQAELADIAGSVTHLRSLREGAEAAWADAQHEARAASTRVTAIQALAEAGHAWLRARQAEADAAAECEAADAEARDARCQADEAAGRGRVLTAHQERLRERLAALADLRTRLPAAETARATEQQGGERLTELTRQREAAHVERQTTFRHLAQVEHRVAELSASISQLEQRCAERQRLLGALSRHLDGARCPLCGHDWEEADLLYRQVQDALQESPPELLAAQQKLAAEAGRLELLRGERTQAANRLSALEIEIQDWERRTGAARTTIQEWQRRAEAVVDGESVPPTPSADLLDRWEEACHATDGSAELAALTAHRTATEQRAATADTRKVAASQALTEAVACTIRTEQRYRAAEQSAPAGVTRPVPGPDPVVAAEEQLTAATRGAQIALESLRGAREELQAAEAARGARSLAQAAVKSRLATTSQALRAAEQRHTTYLAALAGVGLSDEPGAPARALAALQDRLGRLDQLTAQAKWLAGAASARLLSDAVNGVAQRLVLASDELAAAHRQTDRCKTALASVQHASKAVAEARADEQNKRLTDYEPTINEIYRRINPHPYFSIIHLDPAAGVDKGVLTMHASTPDGSARYPVQRYFSMAQANVVALSIFLGTALLQTWSGLRLICIDDPIQQMDDLNTVAFLDVLHSVVQRGRQVVLTTANKEFYHLMLRRYAYLNQQRTRFRAFRLRSVNVTEGPDMAEDSPCFLPDGMVRLGAPLAGAV